MTNKDKYKQAFSALQPSRTIRLEEETMRGYHKRKRWHMAATAAVVCLVLVAGGGGAYAADLGGIQRTVQLWLHGDQTTATVDIHDDGTYVLHVPSADGETAIQSGGGKAFDAFGNERALSEEDIMEQLMAPEVTYYDDGSIWFFYENMARDITDLFDAENICYLQVEDEEGSLYVTIEKYGGYSYSHNKYLLPDKDFVTGNADPDSVAYRPASEKPDAK